MATLEELRARRAERDQKRQEERDALEAEALELEEKYETSGQRLHIDFDVVTTLVGNFVVRKPDFLVAKKFADAETKTVEDVIQFVAPCVLFPEQMIARGMFTEHGGIAYRLSLSLLKLYEADAGKQQGK